VCFYHRWLRFGQSCSHPIARNSQASSYNAFALCLLSRVVVYGIALSIFFGAGVLPLKLHRALLGGAVGLVCLVSVAMNKPIFLLFIRRYTKSTKYAEQTATALADPRFAKRISNLTLIIGIACLADAVLQTALAIVLSTSAFLIATTSIHVAAVVGIVLGVFLLLWVKSNR